jgi:hypothetical protein
MPASLAALLAAPWLVDAIIAGVIVEGVALAAYRRRTGRGMPVRELASFLGAGLALLVALRTGSGPRGAGGTLVFAGAMAVGLACHVWHLAQRWDV